MKRPYSTARSAAVCRRALEKGNLVACHHHGLAWKFGRRKFNSITVSRLIEAGEAVREGNIVRKVK
ncbi:hypothetical protein [Tardiphaga sp.]|jgi:hypothetical protein|uniref:hypothetical protein n=1 Tax=Tardiphaga sp. TaxID=1926292 RepID=UPI0037D9C1F4